MKKAAITVAVFASTLLFASTLQAQTVTYSSSTTIAPLATVQAWTPTLYVNNTPFVLTQTCTLGTTPAINCSAPLPNISTALTPTGNQTFAITFKDPILGESSKSVPLVLVSPVAPTSLAIH
jgi:hypothetical protein